MFRIELKADRDGSSVSRILLSAQPRIASFYEKTLAKLHQTPHPMWTEYQWPAEAPVDDSLYLVDPAKVVDLTDHLAADGTLTWDVPEGDWVILRTGMTPTGQKNAPAVPEATGYETDKMSREHIKFHFDSMIGKSSGGFPKRISSRSNTWCKTTAKSVAKTLPTLSSKKFAKEFGYDPTPIFRLLRNGRR